MKIDRVDQFNLALSLGAFAWPGGYPQYFVTHDGGVLSFESARENAGLIREAIIHPDLSPIWKVVAMRVNWEDNALFCDSSNEQIPSACGDDCNEIEGED